MVTNKNLSSLKLKKDFLQLKRKGVSFYYQWVRACFVPWDKQLCVAWSLSKKNVPRALDRNRFKRYGRELLKESCLKGDIRISFFKQEKLFYSKLRRKDFDVVFRGFIKKTEQLSKKRP